MVDVKKLEKFCIAALEKSGMSNHDASIIADVLVTTDRWGVFTHGTKNLNKYIEKEKCGGVSFVNQPEIVFSMPSFAIIDGNNAMGYVSSVKAMNLACDMAENTGIAIVGVKNSCHFGAVGYYSNIAAKRGLLGIAMSNVDKKMAIPGAKGMVMGHNPFSLAAPATVLPSVFLDTSSSNVASLKVLRAKETGSLIPPTWISDKDGLPTTDPSNYPEEGALLPMGSYKGFGIAMFIEILTSIMMDKANSTTEDVLSWCFDLDRPNNVCHTFIAINAKSNVTDTLICERIDDFVRNLHDAPKAKGTEKITVPGEDLWNNYNKTKNSGIDLPEDVINELTLLSNRIGIPLDIFGD